jgi:hypothetical protein
MAGQQKDSVGVVVCVIKNSQERPILAVKLRLWLGRPLAGYEREEADLVAHANNPGKFEARLDNINETLSQNANKKIGSMAQVVLEALGSISSIREKERERERESERETHHIRQ